MKEIPDPSLALLKDLIHSSTPSQLNWIAGYIQGILDSGGSVLPVQQSRSSTKKISILFGTETGNAKRLATELSARCKKQGIQVKVKSLENFSLQDLVNEEFLFAIVSTQGDGEPPLAAKSFFESLENSSPSLEHLKFGVLALGDSSYPLFCKAGEDLDHRLEILGGKRVIPIQKCDTDYTQDSNHWFGNVLAYLLNEGETRQKVEILELEKKTHAKHRIPGTIKTHILLNDRGSNKKTYHLEIRPESPLDFLPGDSLSLVPENPKETVLSILEIAQVNGKEKLDWKGESLEIENVLLYNAQIIYLPKRIVQYYSAQTSFDIPDIRIDLLDLLKIYPAPDWEIFKDLINHLDPITPRLYSIASSPIAHEGEIHITVALNTFEYGGQRKFGHCSSYLSNKTKGQKLNLLIHRNDSFRLPHPDKNIIMIGPGTGIAPFRSFLFERDASLASGKNWLFFGEQHAQTDFLYQTEIQDFLSTGLLHKLNLAFSRDQVEKEYVWHEMLKVSKELMQWIEEGAYIYVCGTRDPMSLDVERTLLEIFGKEKKWDLGQAKLYLEKLKEDGQYIKDVY